VITKVKILCKQENFWLVQKYRIFSETPTLFYYHYIMLQVSYNNIDNINKLCIYYVGGAGVLRVFLKSALQKTQIS